MKTKYIITSNKLYCRKCGKMLKDLNFEVKGDTTTHLYFCQECKIGYKVKGDHHKKNKKIN